MIDKKRLIRGQGIIEYILLVAFMAISGILALEMTGINVGTLYCNIARSLGSEKACTGSYFSDNFDGDLSEWEIIKGKWKIKDGQLCSGQGESQIFKDIPADDYEINLNGATLGKGDGFGLFFRATDPKKVNGYTFQYDPGYNKGSFIMRKWANGKEFPPFDRNDKSDFKWHNTPHDIKVVVKGDTFSAYVDGQLVAEGSDPTFAEGGIGVRTWDSSDACFDSISIDPVQ